jgi:hypothetical protein
MSVEFRDLVAVMGVVRLLTNAGLFLSIQNRNVFVDATYIAPLPPGVVHGETVTLWVSREYAQRKGLVA